MELERDTERIRALRQEDRRWRRFRAVELAIFFVLWAMLGILAAFTLG